METLTIRAYKRVEYAIPVTVKASVAKAAKEGDMDAWGVVEKAVEQAYNPTDHWIDEDEFDPSEFEIRHVD